MAVVATNRKRGFECFCLSPQTTIPFPHSPNSQAMRTRRFSCRMHQNPDNQVSSSNAAISKHSRYPAAIVSLRREFHAHRRGFLRFRLLVRSSVLKRKPKPRDYCGNQQISCDYDARKAALRFHEKDNEVEDDPSQDSVSEDLSIEVVKDDRDPSSTWGKNWRKLRVPLLRQSSPLEFSHEPFLPLKEEEKAEVNSAFSGRNRTKVLVSHKNSNIDICGKTLQCLRATKWLNDEVINLYLELLKERETRYPLKYFKCHFFNTFFYIKLVSGSGYNYKAVRRWTTQRKLGYDLMDCDIIFVPIHGGVHWTLAVINNRECKFLYLDPLKEVGPTKVLKDLAKYLVDEVKDKSGKDIDVSSWDFECVKDLPRQQNGSDCGMFMLKYIDFYSRGLRLHFSQKDMPYFRLRTAKEILRLRAH